MSTIVTRLGKGSPLTNLELDSNFSNLNADKLEISAFDTTANSWFNNKTLNDLSNVVTSSLLNGQALVWNSIANRWENQTISGGGSGLEGGSVEVVAAGSQTIDSFGTSAYTSIKYLVQATYGNDIHTTEITLIHNGTNVYLSEYGTVQTLALFTIGAEISGETVELKVITLNNNTYIDYKRIPIVSRIQVNTLTGDLMLLSGLEDLQTGSGLVDLQA
jgi:hypothetical protein